MYDLDGDEKISKEELLAVLTMMVGENISEDQLESIAERTIHEADEDKDTKISFDVRKFHAFSSHRKLKNINDCCFLNLYGSFFGGLCVPFFLCDIIFSIYCTLSKLPLFSQEF